MANKAKEVKPVQTMTFPVKDIRHITKNVDKAIIVLTVDGYEKDIVRSEVEFLIDLQNSGIVSSNATVGSFEYNEAIAEFKQGLYENWNMKGEMRYNEVGDTIVLDAGHPDVKNGDAKAGDTRQVEKESFWIEGFLSFRRNEQEAYMHKQRKMNAAQLAAAQLQQMFGNTGVTTSGSNAGNAADTSDLPETEDAEGKTAKAALGKDS